jgi:hypothetical protein
MRLYKKHQEGGIFNIPGDKTYEYKTEDDKYFTKKKDSTNWIELNEKTLKNPEVYKEVVTTLKQYAPQSVEKKDSTESKQKNNSTEEILITNFDSKFDYKINPTKKELFTKLKEGTNWVKVNNQLAYDKINAFLPETKWTGDVRTRVRTAEGTKSKEDTSKKEGVTLSETGKKGKVSEQPV